VVRAAPADRLWGDQTARVDDWPLVGRDAELALALDACRRGGVVFAGAAGVGKTRLASELVAQLAPQARAIRVVATRSAASIPLGAFAALVPSAGGPDAQTVNAIVGQLRTDAAERGPLVLLVDDAHLLDDASAALLHRIVIDHVAAAVVTARSIVPSPDPVVALWKDAYCRRVDLQQLSTDETAQLVAYSLPGAVDDAVTSRLGRLAHGNPMMLRELLRGALDAGALGAQHGAWTWKGPLRVPPALVDLVAERLSVIEGASRDLLKLIAFAEPLATAALLQMRGHTELEYLLEAGLVSIDVDGAVRLAHPLYAEIVRSELTAPTITRFSAELAHAYPKQLDDAADELRRVVWHVDAGGVEDPDGLLDAVSYAQLHDLTLACRLAKAAVRSGAGMELKLRLADILTNLGRLDEADKLLSTVSAGPLDDRARVAVSSMRATTLVWLHGRPTEALAVLDEAAGKLHDPTRASDLWAIRLQAAMQDGQVDELARTVEHVLDTAVLADEARSGVLVAGVAAWLLAGELDVAFERCTKGLESARRSSDAFPVRDLLEFGIALSWLYRGEFARAEARFTTLRKGAGGETDVALRFLFSQGLGRVAMLRGQAAAATASFGEARALLSFSPDLIAWNLGLLAQARALAGNVEAATAALAEANDLTSSALFAADRARADALIAWAHGERSRAASTSIDTLDWSLERAQRLPALLSLHDAACFGAPKDALARRDRVIDGFPGELAPALAAHVEALAIGDSLLLHDAADGLEALGCWQTAAHAATAAAAAFDATGLRARAADELRRAQELFGRAEGRVAADISVTAVLTRREREVAVLAANGESDRDIAKALHVSIRTVETHLHRVYSKLGIEHGRSALRSLSF
jgi:DNA-binding CsgD family transcriptional regulator